MSVVGIDQQQHNLERGSPLQALAIECARVIPWRGKHNDTRWVSEPFVELAKVWAKRGVSSLCLRYEPAHARKEKRAAQSRPHKSKLCWGTG